MAVRIFVTLLCLCGHVTASDFYAAPDGSASNDGSLRRPWSLQAALGQPAALHPGDTLWLRGGSYAGRFTSKLRGTATARIRVMPYENEQPVIDSAGQGNTILQIAQTGGYTDYIGLEIKGSAPQRWGTDIANISYGNCPANGVGVDVLAPSTRIINFKIHDTCQAIGFWRPATDSELYGNILYNNGIDAPDRGHGHAIYAQNDGPAWKRITGNVILAHWSQAFHIYGGRAALNYFDVENNIAFLSSHIFGGGLPLQHLIFSGNVIATPSWRFYHSNQTNSDLVFDRNYLFAPLPAFWWDAISAHGNTIYNPVGGWKFEVRGQPGADIELDFDENRYIRGAGGPDYIGTVASARGADSTQYVSFSEWRAAGHDQSGSVMDPPSTQEILYFPNSWEPKRGHVFVANWPMLDTASVDLARLGYVSGDAYAIWDLQAMGDSKPLQTGIWKGTPIAVNLAYAGFTLPTGDHSPQCWNVDCSTCDPKPAGCSTHPAFAPVKTSKQLRAYLVRNIPSNGREPQRRSRRAAERSPAR